MNDRPTKKYCCIYRYDEAWWSITIDAYDWDDARQRAHQLNVKLDGEYVASVRWRWLANLICLWNDEEFHQRFTMAIMIIILMLIYIIISLK